MFLAPQVAAQDTEIRLGLAAAWSPDYNMSPSGGTDTNFFLHIFASLDGNMIYGPTHRTSVESWTQTWLLP